MMITALTLALFCAIKYSNAIVIQPDTDLSGTGITVAFADDPRGVNNITANNEWKMFQAWGNSLTEWYVFHPQHYITTKPNINNSIC